MFFEKISCNDLSMICATSDRLIHKIISYGLRNLKFYAHALVLGFYHEPRFIICNEIAKSAYMKQNLGIVIGLMLWKNQNKIKSMSMT